MAYLQPNHQPHPNNSSHSQLQTNVPEPVPAPAPAPSRTTAHPGKDYTVRTILPALAPATTPYPFHSRLQPAIVPRQYPPNYNHQWSSTQKEKTKKNRACDLCRRKKIRCDFHQLFPDRPCSSCRNYEKLCTFNETGKKRGPPKGYVEKLENRLKRMETLLVGLAESGSISSESIQQMLKDPDNGESQEDSDESEGSMHVAHPIPEKKRLSNTPHQDQWQQKKSKTVITTSTSAIAVEPTNTTDSIESIESPGSVHSIDSGELHSFEKGFCDPQYPPKQNMTHYKEDGKRAGNMFSYMGSSSGVYLLSRLFSKKKALAIEIEKRIRPLEKHQDDSMVSTMDHEKYTKTRYLLSENYALSGQTRWELPPRPVMDLLIQVYFTHFNPYMPIIEEEEFRAMYERNKDPFLNSLLAVIGRSSARIMDDSHPIMKQHSISCLGLFDSLTDQIKTNIRLDFSAPKIEMIQVLMIGVCNMEGWVSESLSWLSIGLAVKMAQELGLHRSKPQWGIPKKTAEAHKRIWWIMYTIDQWICAALGRPMIVSDADCDVEFPEIDDLSDNPALHYHLILIHTIKLSGILGDVLRTLCSPRARFINAKEERMAQVSENLMKVLREWEQSLPSSLRLSQEETESISRKTISRELLYKVNSGAGQLFIVFCSVILQTLCPFFNVLPDNTYEEMPSACFYYIQSAVDVIELIDVRSLMYFGWAITSFGLAQVYTFVLFSKQSTHGPPPDIVKKQEAVMKKIYTSLEKHITQPSILSNVLKRLTQY